jgi:hypothetical protein
MNRPKLIREAVFWSLLLAVGLTYFEPAFAGHRGILQKDPSGYYNQLTDAFASGQLSLKALPDPRLLKLENPYVPQLDVPRPHDMSLFKGKLYLYFGAAPAVMLFLPCRLLTGRWLSEQYGTIVFCFAGVTLAAIFLRRVRDRYLEGCSDLWLWTGIGAVAWGSPAFYLSKNGTFYAVPIGCAFFCVSAAVFSAERALAAESIGSRCRWLAATSFAFGLAVGSRPNYVFCLPVFAFLWLYIIRRSGLSGPNRPFLALAAAVGPVALVGTAIATYNFLRFENPFEFGMRFALMPEDMRKARIIGTEFLAGNLRNYLFETARYVRYFPFFMIDRAYGMVLFLPLTLLGPLVILLPRLRPRDRDGTALAVLGVTIFGIMTCNLFSLCIFYYFGELRYMADFVPAALVVGALSGMAVMNRSIGCGRGYRWASAAVIAGLSVLTIVNGSLAALQDSSASALRRLDQVTYWSEREAGAEQGPIEAEVQFPTDRAGHREPLLSTGVSGRGDIVYVEYLGADRARIGFFHIGVGGPTSSEFALTPGPHRVTMELGSLYPPDDYPGYYGLPPSYVDALRRKLEVSLDGKSLLHASTKFYFATPGLVHVGANPLAIDVCEPTFTGRIANSRRLGLPAMSEVLQKSGESGPMRLHVRFPRGRGGPGEPLVSTGAPGAGDIFYVTYLGGSSIRFGIENSGDILTTEPVTVDFDNEHVVDLEMGSLYPPAGAVPVPAGGDVDTIRKRYSVRLDGRLLIAAPRNFQPSASGQVVCGLNTIRASTAEDAFTGTITSVGRIAAPPSRMEHSWGPLDAWIVFPTDKGGLVEPLVATGKSGKGDIIFVKYEDAQHVRIGFDHWGVGGPVGTSIPLDLSRPHHVEVTMGSLYPPEGGGNGTRVPERGGDGQKDLIEVKLDGVVALLANLPTFESLPDQIAFWSNPIGASSCRDRFTGVVVESLPPER